MFDQSGPTAAALPSLHNSFQQRADEPLPIRLDDGSVGTLRVESKPCTAGDACEPFDCGCAGNDESYWADVFDSRLSRVAHMHLWAAYGVFDIVAVDLIDGPGDELVIVRVPAHASPPTGHDLKIWKIGSTKPVDLLEPLSEEYKVANIFGTQLIGCARWRTHLFVDRIEVKLRAVALRREFAATVEDFDVNAVCRLASQEASRLATLRGGQVLRCARGMDRFQ